MTKIYYKPHKSRKREEQFYNKLRELFPNTLPCRETFLMPANVLNQWIDTQYLIRHLEQDTFLTPRNRDKCITALQKCPKTIKVVTNSSQISFDIVIEESDRVLYFEFHEEQHRRMTITRAKKIYTCADETVEVPRFLQRLVRDVWRALYFRPYVVVWSDWFEVHHETFSVPDHVGYQEYYLENRFSFKSLLSLE